MAFLFHFDLEVYMHSKAAALLVILLLFPITILSADENTDQAWQALTRKEYAKARTFTQKCLKKSKKKALQQKDLIEKAKAMKDQSIELLFEGVLTTEMHQSHAGFAKMLANKELNDTATSEFIEAESLKGEGKKNEAKNKFSEIAREYKNAYCWDPRGWYWNVAEVAQDKLDTMDTTYDYGDYKSETLTVKAWESLKQKDLRGIELYANKCIKLYEKKARAMKAGISAPPAKETAFANWALNDVATCYYIQGERYLSAGDQEKAKEMFGKAAELGFAVCWDPKGWHWNVAEVSKDKLETIGTKYEYGDYKSETLTAKAWKALEEKDSKGIDLFTNKCIYLFEKEAQNMKNKATADPAEGKEAENWAMNDVATCYYLQGEKLLKEGKTEEAKQIYGAVKKFTHAFCWNPKGWYFNISEAAQDRLDTIGTKYDFGDYQSSTLVTKAWECLAAKDYFGALKYAMKCSHLYNNEAKKMEKRFKKDPSLKEGPENWALNDVATSYFIAGEISAACNDYKVAKKMYEQCLKLTHAVCLNPKGWYFKVAAAAQDRIDLLGTQYDYEDCTSQTLTKKAWDALLSKDYKGVELYANKCILLYESKAQEMKTQQTGYPQKGEEPLNWALNDVATCYYLLGDLNLIKSNDPIAKEMYGKAAQFGFAMCWDPQGWYFKIGDTAKDKLDLWGTQYSYSDYRSVTLTNKAWQALIKNDYQGVELYAKKCAYLYEEKAKTMQGELSGFAKPGFAPYYWALNDVGTCYFILGESYKKQGNAELAKAAYQTAIDQFRYAQCWDPRGWYWKVSIVAQEKMKAIQ